MFGLVLDGVRMRCTGTMGCKECQEDYAQFGHKVMWEKIQSLEKTVQILADQLLEKH